LIVFYSDLMGLYNDFMGFEKCFDWIFTMIWWDFIVI
jgi:hypothetical protein